MPTFLDSINPFDFNWEINFKEFSSSLKDPATIWKFPYCFLIGSFIIGNAALILNVAFWIFCSIFLFAWANAASLYLLTESKYDLEKILVKETKTIKIAAYLK